MPDTRPEAVPTTPMPADAGSVPSRPRVVIIGAGFGGLQAAQALDGAPVDVTVIDRENHHLFQPLLYQVATASLSPADIAWPIRGILRRQRNATVLMADVHAIDTRARVVHAGDIAIPYDQLILATGATHSYFGHDDWADAAPGLKRIEDATTIRRRLLLAFERAEMAGDEALRQRLLTFVVVGAGPTGVEMAGAIVEIARKILAPDFRRIDPRAARVVLVEAGPGILASFPQDLADYARTSLTAMGVEVLTGARVTACDADGVSVDLAEGQTTPPDSALVDGRIEAGTVVWGAGVVASPAARWIGAPHDRAGRIQVSPDLSVPGHPEIFAIGDTASVTSTDGKPVPGIAPAAKQMGAHVAALIRDRAAGKTASRPFTYHHEGDLATIGRRSAVVKRGRMKLTGYIGWLFWGFAHVYFLIGLRYRIAVAFKWAWDYMTLQRGARLITGTDHDGPVGQTATREPLVPHAAPQPQRAEGS
ncbi:NADH dehydrogenase [Tistrella bauzanensis]|uniref:NADH:ubiquinone reductase (non-electrogenic) n=1 Tax=Tistrella bauzanensis TaxID=657419 RepID=A0ABQ1INA5_9PROT|nr:NADH dehydrogenase [Tistrella bauzanensis]